MSFGSVIFSYSVQQGTITWSDCDVWWKGDFIWQLTMTSSVVGLSSSKALPRAKLKSTNERSWPLLGSLLPVWSTIVGFNSESQGNHYIWEVCSANQWDAPKLQRLQLALVNRKCPVLLHNNAQPQATQPMLQKLNELGYKVLPHPPYSCHHSPTIYHFFKHLDNFFQGKHFHNHQETENAFQEFVKSWSMDFYTIGISKLISHWQNCVNCNGSYFD